MSPTNPRPAPPTERFAHWPDVLLCLMAICLGLCRAFFHARHADIGFDDESGYLTAGLQFFHVGPPTGENSPLYALWYWVESTVFADPVTLYQANWGILATATLLVQFLALRSAGVGILGTGLALILMSIAHYFDVWPHVTALSGVLVLSAAIAGLRTKARPMAYSAMATVFAIAVFVRPEFLVSFVLILGVAAFCCARERALAPILLPVVAFVALAFAFGVPFGGGRSMVAFGQHYALNVVQARHLQIDSWNHWTEFVEADFGSAATPLQAMVANPRAFAWHVGMNATNIPRNLSLLAPSFPVIGVKAQVVAGAILAMVLGFGVYRAVRRIRSDERGRRLVVVAACLLVPYLISALLVAPRPHYFMAPLAALSLLGCHGLAGMGSLRARWLLAAGPLPFLFIGLTWAREAPSLPNLATIRVIEGLPLPGSGVIVEPDFGRAVYARLNYRSLSSGTCSPFSNCLRTDKPAVIVSDARLRSNYAGDAGFDAFARRPSDFGFDIAPVPGTDILVYFLRGTSSTP